MESKTVLDQTYQIKSQLLSLFFEIVSFEAKKSYQPVAQILQTIKESSTLLNSNIAKFLLMADKQSEEEVKTDIISMSGNFNQVSENFSQYNPTEENKLELLLIELGNKAVNKIQSQEHYFQGISALFSFLKQDQPLKEQKKFCEKVAAWLYDIEMLEQSKQEIMNNAVKSIVININNSASSIQHKYKEFDAQVTDFLERLNRFAKTGISFQNKPSREEEKQQIAEQKQSKQKRQKNQTNNQDQQMQKQIQPIQEQEGFEQPAKMKKQKSNTNLSTKAQSQSQNQSNVSASKKEEEKKVEVKKEPFDEQILKGNFKIKQTVKTTYENDGTETLIQGNEVLYYQNETHNINVLQPNLELSETININSGKFLHCLELPNKELFICASWKDNLLRKFTLPEYIPLDCFKTDRKINHILEWKDNQVVVCCDDGEIVLFDYSTYRPIAKAQFGIYSFFQTVKCLEDNNKIVACGYKGVYVFEVKNNQITKLNEEYCQEEYILSLMELNSYQYAVCYSRRNNKLIGIIDRKSGTTSVIQNPIKEDETLNIERVKGLEHIAVIQAQFGMFLFHCKTHQITHILSHKYTYLRLTLTAKFNDNNQQLSVFGIYSEGLKKRIRETLIMLK